MFTKKNMNYIKKLKYFFTTRTIQSTLLIVLLLVALLPAAVINFYYYFMMHKEINDKIQVYSSEIVRQVGRKIDNSERMDTKRS